MPRGNNPITHSSVDFETAVDELCEALRRKNVLPESSADEADAVFKRWDRNGDGHLDSDEVLVGCLQLGMEPDEAGSFHHSFIRSLVQSRSLIRSLVQSRSLIRSLVQSSRSFIRPTNRGMTRSCSIIL